MPDDFYNEQLDVQEQRQREQDEEELREARVERESDRRDEVRTDWKPAPRVKRREAPPERAWAWSVLERDHECRVHRTAACCAEGWEAHHVVPQQTLRRTHAELLWNPLSGMLLCGLAHRQHHNRVRPIRLDEIPPMVVVFLMAHEFGWYLERHYPASGEPQRGGQA